MKVSVNQETCIGCGACASTCGEVFEIGDDGKSHVKADVDLIKNEKCIKEAIDGCPVQAITAE
jgi:ferredoxin